MTKNRDLTILIVDDDSCLRTVIVDEIKGRGYRTLEAGNGEEAIEVAMASQPDLILSDVRMPVLDGEGLLNRLNDLSLGIPIVLMSGDCHLTRDDAIEKGALDLVSKPFSCFDSILGHLERRTG